jgi:hypothetical protein
MNAHAQQRSELVIVQAVTFLTASIYFARRS